MGSNYGPTVYVQREAVERGLQQVLWLYGEDNEVTEVGTMNIFMFYINDDGGKLVFTIIFDSNQIESYPFCKSSNDDFKSYVSSILPFVEKELITPPLSRGLILPGITRNSILAIAREWNQFKVSERKFCMNEICQLLSENRVRPLSHLYCTKIFL